MRNGYPFRMPHAAFFDRYHMLVLGELFKDAVYVMLRDLDNISISHNTEYHTNNHHYIFIFQPYPKSCDTSTGIFLILKNTEGR